MKTYFTLLLSLLSVLSIKAASIYVEAENFRLKGGWVVDQQFMEQVGSSYLMAHGMGKQVEDATTTVLFPEVGT